MSYPYPLLTLIVALLCLIAHVRAEVIVAKGSADWSYLHITDGTDPAIADTDFNTTWFNPTTGSYTGLNYNGPAFVSGASPFHYGVVDGLSGGTLLGEPADGLRYTTYFYKVIDGGSTGYTSLNLSMLADDGAYVYLNGQLLAIDSVAGNDTFTNLSNDSANEYAYDQAPLIGHPIIRPGPNLLAVSAHQVGTDSSDLGLDLELTGEPMLASTSTAGWAMLSPINGDGHGFDPATDGPNPDPDFDATWKNQNFGGYNTGVAYDGPAFATGLTGPFAYGGVTGISAPATAIPQPSIGSRGSAYFIREIDGGATGYDALRLSILADDGAYVYLNGAHVATVGALQPAATADNWYLKTGIAGSESTTHEFILTGTQWLHPGPNLVAVSLHNHDYDSEDLGFTLDLVPYTPHTPSVSRGPYLQSGGHDRITLRWRTDEPGTTVVRYGDAPGNLTQTYTANESVTEHIATLTGLSSATTYFYEIETVGVVGTVSEGAGNNHYFKTSPTPGAKAPARIWVIGDSGTTRASKFNVYDAYRTFTGATHTDAWLMLGDNAYDDGSDAQFQAALFDSYPELLRNTVLWSCIGNHDIGTADGQPYLDQHTFPENGECGGVPSGSERYYSFDHGNIHFISIDSQTDGNYDDAPGNPQGMVDWLEADLLATDKDWIIAYFHHAPYTKGEHDSDTEDNHIKVRRYVTPLLEKYGCDLVLSGHSHAYERSPLLNGHHSDFSTASSTSATFNAGTHVIDGGNGSATGSVDSAGNFIATGADGPYQKPLAQGEAGTLYAVCGAAGKLDSWINGSTDIVNPAPHPALIVNLRVMGSLVLDISGNSLRARYLDEDNVVRDDFTLVKGSTIGLAATDTTFAEHGADATAAFEITRSGATSFAEDVHYTLSGNASNGTDFSPALSGTIAFAADETVKSVILTRLADNLAEGLETLTLTLANAQQTPVTGAILRDRYCIGTSNIDSLTLSDAPSQSWWFNAFGGGPISPGDWELDNDNDGINRLQELAFGGVEGENNRNLLPQIQVTSDTLELHYSRNNSLTELQYVLLGSYNLTDWNEPVSDILAGSTNPTGVELRKGSISTTGEPRTFLKLGVEFIPTP